MTTHPLRNVEPRNVILTQSTKNVEEGYYKLLKKNKSFVDVTEYEVVNCYEKMCE